VATTNAHDLKPTEMRALLAKVKNRVLKEFADKRLEAFQAQYFSYVPLSEDVYGAPIHRRQQGNDLLRQQLESGKPFMATRLGNYELRIVVNYLYFQKENRKTRWLPSIQQAEGIFPKTPNSLQRFADTYLEEIPKVDVLGVWFNTGEEELFKKHCPGARLMDLWGFESFLFQNPWTAILESKRVLVIHPYDRSIQKQYSKRDLLFQDSAVLPLFELKTYRPFNIYTDMVDESRTWFDELDKMKQEINAIDFDIALIAAGPFGLPLAGHIKMIGKQAVHIGGALQLLFGIIGQRWETMEQSQFFNEHWVRPSVEETPELDMRMKADGGCYW
jgi:hypothetical protein